MRGHCKFQQTVREPLLVSNLKNSENYMPRKFEMNCICSSFSVSLV